MDNLYFVGTGGLGTFLVTTPEGHILINTDFERTIPLIEESVAALGFDLDDVKIILGSHAHGDHQAADVFLRERTGAQVMIMQEDVAGWQRMNRGDNIPIERILHDGDEVTLGGTTLVAHRTPGHTRGCTSWGVELEEGGETYNALIVCSFGVNANYVLVDNPNYPDIADDYRATFAKARAMPVDVFVASHGSFYDLPAKHEKLLHRMQGDPNPFVDHAGFLAYIDFQEGRFQAMLDSQRRSGR
jgi:metallo-beta-lactamase class B